MNVGGSAGRPTDLSSIIKIIIIIKIKDIAMTKINGHCLVCLYSMDAECFGVGIREM